jgi:sugar phosphate isomerase/epimerase
MNIGMTSSTFYNNDVDTVLKYAKTASICGIEWGEGKHIPFGDITTATNVLNKTIDCGIKIFSFASYYIPGEDMDFLKTLFVAKALGAPIIRIWAGKESFDNIDSNKYNKICKDSYDASIMAKEENIKVAFEYHQHSLTDNSKSALRLMNDIGSDNIYLYWQPNGMLDVNGNSSELTDILPFLAGNIHIHNYKNEEYHSLEKIKTDLQTYFKILKKENKQFNALIEFTANNKFENFVEDVRILKSVV